MIAYCSIYDDEPRLWIDTAEAQDIDPGSGDVG